MKKIISIILMMSLLYIGKEAHAYNDYSGYTNDQIANAIFQAEGGYKAKYLYGIVSIKYKDEADARRICLNTIRNNRIRFKNQDKYDDYIEFLGSRYCPINAENDPKGLNKNWVGNVKKILK
jgi:hypothetical protein